MNYKIGDHVVIEKSNIEVIEKFAGRTGVIDRINDNPFSDYPYSVYPDGWLGDANGIWCSVKCLVKHTTPEKIVITHDGKTTTATKYYTDNGHPMKTVATARCAPEDTFDFNVGAELAMKRLMEAVKPVTVDGFKVGDRVTYFGNRGTVICITEGDTLGVEFDTKNKYSMHSCSGFELKSGNTGKSGMCKWANPNDLKHIDPNEPEPPKYYNGKVVCVKNSAGNEIAYTVGKIYEFVDGSFTNDLYEQVGWCADNGRGFTSFEEWNRFSCSDWLEIKE